MENERAKKKKQVLRNFMWAAIFLNILLFVAVGILFYMLIPDLQISPGAEKLLLLVVSIFLLTALFTWVFWYRPALKKYKREYKEEIEMFEKSKISIFLSSRVFKVLLFLMMLLAAGIGWYMGDRIFR